MVYFFLINLDNLISQKMVIFAKNANFLAKNCIFFCKKLQKLVNFSQKIIQKLVFLGQFNAFLKRNVIKKWYFLKNAKDNKFLSLNGHFLSQITTSGQF